MDISADPEAFDCRRCPWGRHCDTDRSRAVPMPDGTTALSAGPAPHGVYPWELDGLGPSGGPLRLNTCPLPLAEKTGAFGWTGLHARLEQGFLAVSGGWMEQPAAYTEAMDLIAARRAHNDRLRQERERREARARPAQRRR